MSPRRTRRRRRTRPPSRPGSRPRGHRRTQRLAEVGGGDRRADLELVDRDAVGGDRRRRQVADRERAVAAHHHVAGRHHRARVAGARRGQVDHVAPAPTPAPRCRCPRCRLPALPPRSSSTPRPGPVPRRPPPTSPGHARDGFVFYPPTVAHARPPPPTSARSRPQHRHRVGAISGPPGATCPSCDLRSPGPGRRPPRSRVQPRVLGRPGSVRQLQPPPANQPRPAGKQDRSP